MATIRQGQTATFYISLKFNAMTESQAAHAAREAAHPVVRAPSEYPAAWKKVE